jgi:1,2-diacylglycerol 3-alpha-glucosyltransferase
LYEKYTHYVPLDSTRLENFVISLASLYANHCDQVIAPSRSIAQLLRARGIHTPIAEIATGVDISFFAAGRGAVFRAAFGIAADALVIGHVGRLAAEKNLDYLAQAVRLFIGDHPKAVFLVVGTGPRKEHIRHIFAAAGMAHHLIMPGQLTSRSLADAYRAMDLFVFASFSETQGLVLTEAMAAGLPVITLDASGVRDVVEDGINGRLMRAATPVGEFAGAIQAAFADPAQMRRWGRAGVQTAIRHSRRACASRLADLYQHVLARRWGGHTTMKELGALESMISRIKLEWELLSGKIKSVVEATSAGPSDEPASTDPPD